MNIKEKLEIIAENIPKVFEAGKQALRDVFLGSKTAWNHFCYMDANIDISNQLNYEDTSNGTKFNHMFNNSTITTIPLFNTSKGTEFQYMFYYAKKISQIPQFDFSNRTNFEYTFGNCSITTLPQLDFSNGTNFEYTFGNCSITTLPRLDFSNGTNFREVFYNCAKLESIESVKFGKGSLYQGFYYCKKLTTIGEIDFANTDTPTQTFKSCSSLQTMNVVGTINTSNFDFSPCTALSIESLRTIKNALADKSEDTSKTWKIIFGSGNLAKFTDDELAEIISKGWVYQ